LRERSRTYHQFAILLSLVTGCPMLLYKHTSTAVLVHRISADIPLIQRPQFAIHSPASWYEALIRPPPTSTRMCAALMRAWARCRQTTLRRRRSVDPDVSGEQRGIWAPPQHFLLGVGAIRTCAERVVWPLVMTRSGQGRLSEIS
jgi:hypothetical protein